MTAGATDSTQARAPALGPADRALGALAWTTGLAWALPGLTAMSALQSVFPADRLDPLTRLYTRGQLAAVGCRVRYQVSPSIDPGRPYMFAQNHVCHLDYCALYSATPHFKQGLNNEDHFRYPFYGWFMKTRGTIPVRRDAARRLPDMREHMRQEIVRGHSLLVFPEGTRTRTGRVGPFRTGVFVAARDLGIPVIPVSVLGLYEVMTPHSWVIRPGRTITVHCDEPLDPTGLADAEIADFAARVRAPIAARVDAYYAGLESPAR